MGEHRAPTFEELLEPLTAKQRAFVHEYLVDLNATEAAGRAGYKGNRSTLSAIGSQNLRKPHIGAALQAAIRERERRTEVTADRVVLELARIAFSRLDHVISWGPKGVKLLDSDGLSDEAAAAVCQIKQSIGRTNTIQVKLHDKVGALKLLAEHTGVTRRDDDDASPHEKAREIRRALDEIEEATSGADA